MPIDLIKDPTMHLFHTPQYTIQNRNVHISVANRILDDMNQVHCGIGLLYSRSGAS